MPQTTLMYLIRHGATLQNEHRPVILQGNGINGPLSGRGEQQAQEVAEELSSRPFVAVYASPMRRAQQTARAIAAPHGMAVQTVENLREVNVGDWEGKTWNAIMDQDRVYYDRFMQDSSVAYRGGESFQDVLERVEPELAQLLDRHRGEAFAVVAHNVVNRVYLSQLLQGDLSRSRQILQTNCCINLVRTTQSIAEVVTVNSVLHLSVW